MPIEELLVEQYYSIVLIEKQKKVIFLRYLLAEHKPFSEEWAFIASCGHGPTNGFKRLSEAIASFQTHFKHIPQSAKFSQRACMNFAHQFTDSGYLANMPEPFDSTTKEKVYFASQKNSYYSQIFQTKFCN